MDHGLNANVYVRVDNMVMLGPFETDIYEVNNGVMSYHLAYLPW